MKVGSIILTTNQGLSYLARDFYSNGLIDEILIQDHPHLESHPTWYESSCQQLTVRPGFPFSTTLQPNEERIVIEFLDKIDLLLFFETPFNMSIIELAKQHNVKTVLMPMYECTKYPINVDAYIAPSALDLRYYKKLYPSADVQHLRIPVPKEVVWKLRSRARTFVHNAGNGGTYGRNGTKELLEAIKYVDSPIKLLIRSQKFDYETNDPRIRIVKEQVKFEDLWKLGDVFIFPEKFNGLSLPLQEACASGMLVMCGDRFPMNKWLPPEPLIKIASEQRASIVNVPFRSAVYDPRDIASKIDEWYDRDIEEYSLAGKKWAEENSWEILKPKYKEIFERVAK